MVNTSHELKCDPGTFQVVLEGRKGWEMRKDDRDYQVGDAVVLCETTKTGEELAAGAPLLYTGRKAEGTVTYKLTGYGLRDGWCILSIKWAMICLPMKN